ncbi:MBL fold metallo-hydrolase [Candidatus Borrarchaeum sp.]|uniref:MBL fold metallo-hydrolase n=1 Tax=Candidatus Borrarchaeum sp. TaxID=2846742 RepID=UPI002580434F|nr:MBL fold metallo-hydrolase [Candidatus Borrarchaeum sp.]
MSLKITILGSGDSVGTPKWDCHCETCETARKRGIPFSRTRFGILIELLDTNKRILIDTGPDLRSQLLTHNIDRIDAIFFTHGHYDHQSGFADFYRTRIPAVEIFGTEETLNYILSSGGIMKSIRYKNQEILPFHPIEYDGFKFTAFPVLHETSPTKPVGYVIEKPGHDIKLVITGDTGFNIPHKSLEFISNPNPDILIVDCFIDNQEDTIRRFKKFVFDFDFFRSSNHLIFPDILEFIERVKPKETYLIHMSHLCAPHDQLESNLKKYEHIKAAYDGLTMIL